MEKKFGLTAKEAAEFLGIPVFSINKLARQGRIPFYNSGKRRLYSVEGLVKWVQEQENVNWKNPAIKNIS